MGFCRRPISRSNSKPLQKSLYWLSEAAYDSDHRFGVGGGWGGVVGHVITSWHSHHSTALGLHYLFLQSVIAGCWRHPWPVRRGSLTKMPSHAQTLSETDLLGKNKQQQQQNLVLNQWMVSHHSQFCFFYLRSHLASLGRSLNGVCCHGVCVS